jgi:hypothetical protein
MLAYPSYPNSPVPSTSLAQTQMGPGAIPALIDIDAREFYIRVTRDLFMIGMWIHRPVQAGVAARSLWRALTAPAGRCATLWRRYYLHVAYLVTRSDADLDGVTQLAALERLRGFLCENADLVEADPAAAES